MFNRQFLDNKIKILLVLCLITVTNFGWVNSVQPVIAKDLKPSFRAGELLIKFKDEPIIHKIQIDDELDIKAVIDQYKNNQDVEFIEPNYLVKAAAFPNDPYFIEQWYLRTVNAPGAWSRELLIREQEKTSNSPIIAVIDTGVQIDHPDLKSKIWVNKGEINKDAIDNDKNGFIDDVNGWDFVNNDDSPQATFDSNFSKDAVNHGTIVAGIAASASHNQEGIAGVSWFARIMPLRVLDSSGTGEIYTVVKAIDYAIGNGADIINMSFVGSGYSFTLADAIRRAYDKNILIVAAAGNTDPGLNGVDMDIDKAYPVCYDGSADQNMVIGVAAVGKNLKKSNFSNYGGCVDLVAPGESFFSTQVYSQNYSGFENYYNGYWSGTSLSAPLVSGALALVKGLRPNLTAKELKKFLIDSSKNIDLYNSDYKNKLGSGLLDVEKLLELALGQRQTQLKAGEDIYWVAGLGVKSFPQVKVLRKDGTIFKAFYAYSISFPGTISVATGDVNSDGKQEIITSPGEGGGPHVRIFNIEGQVISQFFAYNKNLRTGVNIAVGDVDGDGRADIITGSGSGNKSEVKIFDYQGNLRNSFLAYGENFYGGVKVAVGDVDGDGKDEIVTAAGAGGGPDVKVYDLNGNLMAQFYAFNKNIKGSVNIAVGDIHGDGRAEIMAAMEKNSMPIVKIFSYWGTVLGNFFAYDTNFLKGINLSTGDINNDGVDEIITGPAVGGGPHLKAFDKDGLLELEIFAHNANYRGGARPAILKY